MNKFKVIENEAFTHNFNGAHVIYSSNVATFSLEISYHPIYHCCICFSFPHDNLGISLSFIFPLSHFVITCKSYVFSFFIFSIYSSNSLYNILVLFSVFWTIYMDFYLFNSYISHLFLRAFDYHHYKKNHIYLYQKFIYNEQNL